MRKSQDPGCHSIKHNEKIYDNIPVRFRSVQQSYTGNESLAESVVGITVRCPKVVFLSVTIGRQTHDQHKRLLPPIGCKCFGGICGESGCPATSCLLRYHIPVIRPPWQQLP